MGQIFDLDAFEKLG